MLFIFPSNPVAPRFVDEHFAPEAMAARAAGHSVAVVDHDALCSGATEEAVRWIPLSDEGAQTNPALYRGWMLTVRQYTGFAAATAQRGVTLLTSPSSFEHAHWLPRWYDALSALTPRSVWTEGPDLDAFEACCSRLGSGPAVLRDHVKSLKHHWAEAAYIPDVANLPAARAVARRFLELRGEDFAGGLVARAFEQFTTTEARTWWVQGRCVLVTAHPDTPGDLPTGADLQSVAPTVAALGLPFVTVDLVLRADGVWRIVELGDGQVSDRPKSTPPETFIEAITGAFGT
ncbi:ATP-grasp domain-containing protein [Myxococcus sp. K38C18041901]|uniref:ATP-grasp domain-containing protein n=1 Tax=Myxococcus guangdongensis TaxID=2906760 RepID=UPI0020A7334A|nr:ATP-grasp domain-containing protein [Myxococcus guangdongensis]MCP3059891.1 ATP-grasp domain-containing protein [Myxococcus guangdongensis]